MVEALRLELGVAEEQGRGKELRFEVGEVTLSATVAVSRSTTASGGVELWVIKGGAEHAREQAETHKVEVKLRPKYAGQPGTLEIAAEQTDVSFPK